MVVAGARDAAGSVRAAAVGSPQPADMIGMLSVMSTPLNASPRGPNIGFHDLEELRQTFWLGQPWISLSSGTLTAGLTEGRAGVAGA